MIPQANPGPRYRRGKSAYAQPVGHGRREGGPKRRILSRLAGHAMELLLSLYKGMANVQPLLDPAARPAPLQKPSPCPVPG